MNRRQSSDQIIASWMEKDLSAEAAKGNLPPAFELGHLCDLISDILSSGRHPVLTGESGTGKTAAIYELLRRIEAGEGPDALRGKRIIQVSFRRRASSLKKPQEQMRPEMQKLVDALIAADGEIIPFFRDFHFAFNYDLEPQLQLLAFQGSCPILGEGEWNGLSELFEYTPELEQYFVTVSVEEPDLKAALNILGRWCDNQSRDTRIDFSNTAIEEALYLTHRFLARDRLPRKAIDLLTQAAAITARGEAVTADKVLARFCGQHRIPRFLVDPAIPLNLPEVEEHFHSRIFGQEEAVLAVVKMVGLIKAGLSDMRRPFGAFFFVGPTGVGNYVKRSLM